MRSSIAGVLISCGLFLLLTMQWGAQQKYALFVVGVPRSGTSCVAGILKIMGVDFGSNFVEPNQFNVKGYFEDKEFDVFSKEIAKNLGFDPFPGSIINWGHEPKKESYQAQVKKFIAEHTKGSFGVKAPLISSFLPLFLEPAQELGFKPKVIVVIRNPDETVKSWHERWGNVYPIIATYYFNILKDTRNYDTLVISFDDAVHSTQAVVNEINRFIPGLKNYDQIKAELAAFVDKELKHHNA